MKEKKVTSRNNYSLSFLNNSLVTRPVLCPKFIIHKTGLDKKLVGKMDSFKNVVLSPFLFQLCLMVMRFEKRWIRSNPVSCGLNDLAPRSMGGKGESGAG